MRCLICSIATFGFLRPAIGIAQALQRRGHTVAFVTDVSMGPILKRAGMTRIPRGTVDGRSFVVELSGHPLDAARQSKHIDYAVAQFAPDLLVGQEIALGPLIASERHQLPLATLGLATYIWPTRKDPFDLNRFALARHAGFESGYAMARDMLNMAPRPIDPAQTPFIGDLLMLRSVPALESDPALLPPQVAFVGDCDWDLPTVDAEVTAWVAAARASGAPIVYAQPGRTFGMAGFWDQMVEAFGNQPVYVAASVGRWDGTAQAVPPNFFVRGHVPQELVLPYARAVICSSTTTTVISALRYGVPLLLVPGTGGAEQVTLTYHCLNRQVAYGLEPEGLTARQLWEAFTSLIGDQTVAQQVRRIQHDLQQIGGSERAAALVEGLAKEPRTKNQEPTGEELRTERQEPADHVFMLQGAAA